MRKVSLQQVYWLPTRKWFEVRFMAGHEHTQMLPKNVELIVDRIPQLFVTTF